MELRLKCSEVDSSINLKEFARNLLDFNLGSAFVDVLEVNSSNEMKAFSLLFNSTKNTFVKESKKLDQNKLNSSNSVNLSLIEIELKDLFDYELVITEDFFFNVLKHKKDYLLKTFVIFKDYLKMIDVKKDIDFYEYVLSFQNELEKELMNEEKYKDLLSYFDNPLIEQNKKLQALIKYYGEIKSNFSREIRDDSEGSNETLEDLYIEPYFGIHKSNFKVIKKKQFISVGESVHSFLDSFFLKNRANGLLKENYNMAFVLGQPGQGKTSLCYKLIHDYLKEDLLPERKLIFIKIRDLLPRDIIHNIFLAINKQIPFEVDFYKEECLLILDGFDEAYMSGGVKDDDLKYIYSKLNKASRTNKGLKIILTSRINYLDIKDSCVDGSLILSLKGLKNKQIKEYSKKINRFYPDFKFHRKIKEVLKDTEENSPVIELLRQSVLLYFFAISNIELKRDDTRVILYRKLFKSLIKRNWDKSGQLSYFNSSVKSNLEKFESHLKNYVRGVAFKIYQSPEFYITKDELLNLDTTQVFIRKCFDEELYRDNLREINKYLLISFYFQNNKHNDSAIEFFHNSLWEFLTAEYIWDTYKRLLLTKDDDGDYIPLSLEKYYLLLEDLVGNKVLTFQIIFNLIEVIKLEKEEVKRDIYNQSIKVFKKLSEKNYLLRYDYKKDGLGNDRKLEGVFKLAWTFLYFSKGQEVIYTNNNINKMLFKTDIDFINNGEYRQIYFSGKFINMVLLSCDFHDVEFHVENIYNTVFIGGSFHNVTFSSPISLTKVIGCSFKNFKIESCDIEDCDIYSCNFSGIEVKDVTFYGKTILDNFFERNVFLELDKDDFIIERIGHEEVYLVNTK